MTTQREEMIRERIVASLKPELFELTDDSHLHAGHGARGGHYTVHIVSDAFAGKNPVQRHRLVYEAVGDLMNGEIHALSIHAATSAEYHDSKQE
jgi:BolA protein